MFRYNKQKVVQIYFEDKHINSLPLESQVKLIKDCFPLQKINKSKILDEEDQYSCVLLIGSNLYSFSCTFVDVDDEFCRMDMIEIQPFSFETMETKEVELKTEDTEEEFQQEEVTEENEQKEFSEQESVTDVEKESKEKKRSFGSYVSNMMRKKDLPTRWNKKVMNFIANLGKNQIREIMEIEPRYFEVHTYDDLKLHKQDDYPYIYYHRERYNVCFNSTKTINCKTELVAKLLVYYEEDESRKNLLLELDEEEGVQDEMARCVLYKKSEELKDMLEHIQAKRCLKILADKEQEKKH